jgi:hypothetical protein
VTLQIRLALLLWIAVIGCSDTAPRRRAASSASSPSIPATLDPFALPSVPAADWKEYKSQGFTLRYPAVARLVADTARPEDMAGISIRGPDILFDTVHTEYRPTYRLVISAFPNPSGRSARAWVDSVRQARNVERDSVALLGPPDTVLVGGHPGLRLRLFCGDCEAEELYAVGLRRVVVFSIVYDIGIPGRYDAQKSLYAAILSTFRWTE